MNGEVIYSAIQLPRLLIRISGYRVAALESLLEIHEGFVCCTSLSQTSSIECRLIAECLTLTQALEHLQSSSEMAIPYLVAFLRISNATTQQKRLRSNNGIAE